MIKFFKIFLPKFLLIISFIFSSLSAFAFNLRSFDLRCFDLRQGHLIGQLGYFYSRQGKAQNINIVNLIGDRFTIKHEYDQNVFIGLGYYLDGPCTNWFNLSYGVNAFYLPTTEVKGNIIQEHLFPNLSYRYKLYHVPIYLMAKAAFNNLCNQGAVILDLGIGQNIMVTNNYHDRSLDGGFTIPDNAFRGHTKHELSGTAAIGFKVTNNFGTGIECGYRYFYLGEGHLNKRTDQLLNNLKTGHVHAHALYCSLFS